MKLRLSKPNKTTEFEQISFNLKKDKMESYYQVKRKLANVEAAVEALPYWKNFVSVAGFMLMLFLIIVIVYVTVGKFRDFPNQLPFSYSQGANTWRMVDKELYLAVPFALLVALILQIRFNALTFKFDRRLAIMVNLGLILTAILGFIAFVQLFSFVLIY